MTQGAPRGIRILLIEDNLTDAILIRTILEQGENTRVSLAQDGIRGSELIQEKPWDLVVVDINLPGRDGMEVIQHCKIHQPETPILATSAQAATSFQEGAFRAGASEVLSKPIDRDQLLTTVQDLLAGGKKAEVPSSRILAIGSLPGDVEAGCGGFLMKRAKSGDDISILSLGIGCTGDEGMALRAASKRSAQVLGAKLLLPKNDVPGGPDLDEMVALVQRAVQDLDPEIVLGPSSQASGETGKNTFLALDISAGRVETLFGYQCLETTLDFRPTLFEDISGYLDQKMAALSHFEAQVPGRPHLHPGMARASARYWGRFQEYGEVEPLEVVRQPS